MKKITPTYALFILLSGIGSGLILSFALLLAYVLWEMGVNGQVYTHNYSTSVLLTEGLRTASGAAPWALLSVNAFFARKTAKIWRSRLKQFFNLA